MDGSKISGTNTHITREKCEDTSFQRQRASILQLLMGQRLKRSAQQRHKIGLIGSRLFETYTSKFSSNSSHSISLIRSMSQIWINFLRAELFESRVGKFSVRVEACHGGRPHYVGGGAQHSARVHARAWSGVMVCDDAL